MSPDMESDVKEPWRTVAIPHSKPPLTWSAVCLAAAWTPLGGQLWDAVADLHRDTRTVPEEEVEAVLRAYRGTRRLHHVGQLQAWMRPRMLTEADLRDHAARVVARRQGLPKLEEPTAQRGGWTGVSRHRRPHPQRGAGTTRARGEGARAGHCISPEYPLAAARGPGVPERVAQMMHRAEAVLSRLVTPAAVQQVSRDHDRAWTRLHLELLELSTPTAQPRPTWRPRGMAPGWTRSRSWRAAGCSMPSRGCASCRRRCAEMENAQTGKVWGDLTWQGRRHAGRPPGRAQSADPGSPEVIAHARRVLVSRILGHEVRDV